MSASTSLLQTGRTISCCRRLAKRTASCAFPAPSSSFGLFLPRHRCSRPFFRRAAAAALGQAFAENSSGAAHTLSTVRTLPYSDQDLFHIIADVDAYDAFLPHCTLSRVTRWRRQKPLEQQQSRPSSSPSPAASLPSRADLTVGWGPLSQTYSSRVYCIPSRGVVEAVSGQNGAPTLSAEEQAELGEEEEEEEAAAAAANPRPKSFPAPSSPAPSSGDSDPFISLVTRWTVKPLDARESSRFSSLALPSLSFERKDAMHPGTEPAAWSRVELRIRFQFHNPLYQLAAAQVGNEMATKMIEAFEQRAQRLLDPQRRF